MIHFFFFGCWIQCEINRFHLPYFSLLQKGGTFLHSYRWKWGIFHDVFKWQFQNTSLLRILRNPLSKKFLFGCACCSVPHLLSYLNHLFCISPSRNKYTSKSSSSWKLLAQKPEPQELPFASGGRAAQVRRQRGKSSGHNFAAYLVPSGAQLKKIKPWHHLISSWSSSRSQLFSPKLWCAHNSHVIFLFLVRRLNAVLENNLIVVKKK